MASVPTTSTTLLRDLASDSQHPRWTEFAASYRPMMEAYLRERFPTVNADDLVQDTLLAVVSALPSYVYDASSSGHFHNYLTGILRHKAINAIRGNRRYTAAVSRSEVDAADKVQAPAVAESEEDFRHSLMESALGQLMAGDEVSARDKQVFEQVAIVGVAPTEVAAKFGLSRANVDQIKKRMTDRLRVLVKALESADVD